MINSSLRLIRTCLPTLLLGALLVGCQNGQNKALQQKIDSLETANRDLQQRLNEAPRGNFSSEPANTTTLTPPVYFPSGSAWLFNDAKSKLDQQAETLEEKYPNAASRIKGYTDSVPIGPTLKDTYPSNSYLSAQRAAAVAH